MPFMPFDAAPRLAAVRIFDRRLVSPQLSVENLEFSVEHGGVRREDFGIGPVFVDDAHGELRHLVFH